MLLSTVESENSLAAFITQAAALALSAHVTSESAMIAGSDTDGVFYKLSYKPYFNDPWKKPVH